MTLGLVGKKCGMTRVFTKEGISIPVSVIEVMPNYITQLKMKDTDGYTAVQITTGTKKQSKVNKPSAGHYTRAGVVAGTGLWEFRLDDENVGELAMGGEIKVDLLKAGQYVDVTGTTIGKGFAGVIKRHHFSSQDATHGNSLSHRAPGSIGQRQTPGRVFKGKKMAGHMGDVRRTIQNLQVIRVDVEKNLLLIKGAIPGAPGGMVIIKPAVKKPLKDEA